MLIGTFASLLGPGLIRLDHDFASGRDNEAAILALRVLLATAGGASFLPDDARCRALFDRLRAGPFCATLSRTAVDARRAGVFLHREARNLPPAIAAVDNWLWDGRKRITLGDMSDGLVIAPLGPAAARRAPAAVNVPQSLLRAALAVEPALWRDGERLDFVHDAALLSRISMVPAVAPFARFLPSFDLRLAAAVSALIGAPPLPPPPFRGHDRGGAWAKA